MKRVLLFAGLLFSIALPAVAQQFDPEAPEVFLRLDKNGYELTEKVLISIENQEGIDVRLSKPLQILDSKGQVQFGWKRKWVPKDRTLTFEWNLISQKTGKLVPPGRYKVSTYVDGATMGMNLDDWFEVLPALDGKIHFRMKQTSYRLQPDVLGPQWVLLNRTAHPFVHASPTYVIERKGADGRWSEIFTDRRGGTQDLRSREDEGWTWYFHQLRNPGKKVVAGSYRVRFFGSVNGKSMTFFGKFKLVK